MTLSKLITKLKNESLSRYLRKSEVNYFNTPEFFSPLYRNFIDSLIRKEEPKYYQENYSTLDENTKKRLIEDLTYNDNGVIYDRYLLCLYPSHYEPSNPHKLLKEELNEKGLLSYLHKEYMRPSSVHESYKLSREIDSILELVPSKLRDEFKDKAKSSCFKLLVLKYKLGLINQKWIDLFRYRKFEQSKQASMDNIVDFNMQSDSHAKLNTALIKQFYFEIDNGKLAGDKTFSFRIMQVPYYLHIMEEQIKDELLHCLYNGKKLQLVKEKIISRFNHSKQDIVGGLIKHDYDDIDQKMMDQVQHTALVNQYANKILAEKDLHEICDHKIYEFIYSTDWVLCDDDHQRIKAIIKELDLPIESYNKEWTDIACTLSKILAIQTKSVSDLQPHIQKSLCMLAIALIKTDETRNTSLKSRISGSSKNKYSVYNDLKKAHNWIAKNDSLLKDKHSVSILRPTSLSFFNMIYEGLKYSLSCSAIYNIKPCQKDFQEMKSLQFELTHILCSELKDLSHLHAIWTIESYYVNKRNDYFAPNEQKLVLMFPDLEHGGYIGTLEHHFINTEWGSDLESVQMRHQLSWNPLDWMKHQI